MTAGRWRRWAGPAAGGAVILLLVWRFGADAFLDGFRRLDASAVAVAVVVGAVTTVAAAWRWTVVAGGIGLHVHLRSAVGAYYRSQLVNVTVPGGVVGDVERAVRHGRRSGELAACVRSVGWEKLGGQAVQLALTAAVLLAVPSPFRALAEWGAAVLVVIGVLVGVVCAALPRLLRRSLGGRVARALRVAVTDLRVGLLSRRAVPHVLLASAVVVAGHTTVVVVAARATGVDVGLTNLVPLALVVLAGSAVPANVAGWGPREGVAAWAFAATGLGASAGVTAAAAYGALVLLAALPGLAVLALQSVRGRRAPLHHREPERATADA
ncbi:MAG: lysylphosphatidylglycerol synthase transmembrane domain-containing protein [Lapillicoccus sp.]